MLLFLKKKKKKCRDNLPTLICPGHYFLVSAGVCMHAYMYICMCVHVCVHVYVCADMYVCVCAGPYKCPGPFLTWSGSDEGLGKLLGQMRWLSLLLGNSLLMCWLLLVVINREQRGNQVSCGSQADHGDGWCLLGDVPAVSPSHCFRPCDPSSSLSACWVFILL